MGGSEPTYEQWCATHGVSHLHCPSGLCQHPQPFVADGKLWCGRCWAKYGELVEMVACVPGENC